MKLSNIQIVNANSALGELAEEKLKGKLKFRLLELKTELENRHQTVAKSLEGVSDKKEQEEILLEEQDVPVEAKLTEDELEPLPISIKQLASLKPFIQYEQNEDNSEEELDNE